MRAISAVVALVVLVNFPTVQAFAQDWLQKSIGYREMRIQKSAPPTELDIELGIVDERICCVVPARIPDPDRTAPEPNTLLFFRLPGQLSELSGHFTKLLKPTRGPVTIWLTTRQQVSRQAENQTIAAVLPYVDSLVYRKWSPEHWKKVREAVEKKLREPEEVREVDPEELATEPPKRKPRKPWTPPKVHLRHDQDGCIWQVDGEPGKRLMASRDDLAHWVKKIIAEKRGTGPHLRLSPEARVSYKDVLDFVSACTVAVGVGKPPLWIEFKWPVKSPN